MVSRPTITLKNIPPHLHQRLKARAQQRGRSLNSEVLHILGVVLAQELGVPLVSSDAMLVARVSDVAVSPEAFSTG